MKNILLFICDPDAHYLNRLNGYIQHREYSPFIVRTYTDLNVMTKETDSPDLLLVNTVYIEKLKNNKTYFSDVEKRIHVILLDEGLSFKEMSGMDLFAEPCADIIDKYQSAKSIYDHLVDICAARGKFLVRSSAMPQKNVRVIGIYSPEDKKIQRIFSQAVAKKTDSEHGLFLNFDEFYPKSDMTGSLSDLILAIKEFIKANKGESVSELSHSEFSKDCDEKNKQPHKSMEIPSNCIQKEGNMDIIPPVFCPYDLKEITEEEWYCWLEQLILQGTYEFIIINFGCAVPALCLMELCSEIYIPWISDEEAVCRRFKDTLTFMGQYSVANKIQLIQVEGDCNGLL